MHFLSVIIPTYHRNDLLALCLDRLAPGAQLLEAGKYEVIVTDDGFSPTAQQMLSEKYPWARWVEGPHKGPASNRNNGARHAKGNWLIFTDDDCLPSAGWLQAFYTQIAQASFPCILEGKTTCEEGIHSPLMHAPVNLTGGYLWSCNMALPVQEFAKLEGFDELFPFPHLEDVDFKDRALQLNIPLVFVEAAIVDHPPRKYHTFKKLALTHESEVYYFAKNGKRLSLSGMFSMVLRVKARTIFRNLFHKDVLVYSFSTLYELYYIVLYFGKWNRKYATISQ